MANVQITVETSGGNVAYQGMKLKIDAGDSDKFEGSFVMKLHDFREVCKVFDPLHDTFDMSMGRKCIFTDCMISSFMCLDMVEVVVKFVHVFDHLNSGVFHEPPGHGFNVGGIVDEIERVASNGVGS